MNFEDSKISPHFRSLLDRLSQKGNSCFGLQSPLGLGLGSVPGSQNLFQSQGPAPVASKPFVDCLQLVRPEKAQCIILSPNHIDPNPIFA